MNGLALSVWVCVYVVSVHVCGRVFASVCVCVCVCVHACVCVGVRESVYVSLFLLNQPSLIICAFKTLNMICCGQRGIAITEMYYINVLPAEN